jgi:hypothetical protein
MPRDREKYRYIDVGLERDSWALTMFEEDARRHHMSDQPGKLIALRLTEYYEWKNTPSSRGPLVPLSHTDEPDRSNHSLQTAEDDVLEISQKEAENADEAADYWVSR